MQKIFSYDSSGIICIVLEELENISLQNLFFNISTIYCYNVFDSETDISSHLFYGSHIDSCYFVRVFRAFIWVREFIFSKIQILSGSLKRTNLRKSSRMTPKTIPLALPFQPSAAEVFHSGKLFK